jgi:prolyl 4-hydroxylase
MGGSTQFPRLRQTIEGSWCKFLECGHEKESEGASFKPLVGNAVLFTHYHANGTGHRGSWHAGMPVKRGTKIGMNIMTRQFPGFSGDF